MPLTILIGAQWGDEGKGRFVDSFAAEADIVARYAGGDNAGHTVAVGDTIYKLHLVPSGVLHDRVISVMGNGMVINPLNLVQEIARLQKMGVSITPERLKISSRAHIITPAHIEQDRLKELARGDEALGTTLRGIGPAYLDKTGRRGLRMGELLEIEEFMVELERRLGQANEMIDAHGYDRINVKDVTAQFVDAAEKLRPFITETAVYLNQRLKQGAQVIAEGAQGTLLDVDHGSYPFVTSSSPSVGGALAGLGVGPRDVERVVGVAKAFSTRVGGGPMPTELDGDVADRLRGTGENFWDEFGTTTGRPRRCGWLDAVMLRYAAYVNGFTELVLTKLDVLSGFDELKIAVAYEIDGERIDFPPSTTAALTRATPIYETFAGWDADITGIRSVDELPQAARKYVQFIADFCEAPIRTVSVGPERSQLVTMV